MYQVEKNEKRKKDTGQNNIDPDIGFNEETKLFHCPTAGCAMSAKYKYNIVKQLKSCYSCQQESKKS